MTLFDLLDGPGIVVRGDRDVAAIEDPQIASERVRFERDIVASAEGQFA